MVVKIYLILHYFLQAFGKPLFSVTFRFSIFVVKNKIYDDSRRRYRNYYVLEGTQSSNL